MGNIYGADVVELRSLAQSFADAAQRIDATRYKVSSGIQLRIWVGPLAATFRIRWESEYSRMLHSAAMGLRAGARELTLNADEQERASSPDAPHTVSRNPAPTDSAGPYVPDTDITLTDDDLKSEEVRQGSVGDCWLVAALGSVVDRDPNFIRHHMRQNEDGTWTVTMYRDGKPVEITVEATAPANGAVGGDGQPNWASIYEKAAAVFFGGSYDSIGGGGRAADALAAITGGEARVEGELSLTEIQERLKHGPVVLSSEHYDQNQGGWFDEKIDNPNICPDHAYIVDEVREVDGQLKIHVSNPWGPDGGMYNGHYRVGEIWLTEQEYRENFAAVHSVKNHG